MIVGTPLEVASTAADVKGPQTTTSAFEMASEAEFSVSSSNHVGGLGHRGEHAGCKRNLTAQVLEGSASAGRTKFSIWTVESHEYSPRIRHVGRSGLRDD